MDLYIRSTSRRNFLKMRFLTIMPGSNFYKKDEWEYKGYTIANCSENGQYELLGTYETEERALEVLDEIQDLIKPKIITTNYECEIKENLSKLNFDLEMIPQKTEIQELSTIVYEMPKE